MSNEAEIDECPGCGSKRIVKNATEDYDLCLGCKKAWERLPKGEPYLRDGEMMAFKKPCDNCAFRGNSPERADKEKWQGLQESMAYAGGAFYCHKGVPFDVTSEAEDRDFEYPVKDMGAIHALGQDIKVGKVYQIEKMRLCRGYLNAFVVPEMKRYAR